MGKLLFVIQFPADPFSSGSPSVGGMLSVCWMSKAKAPRWAKWCPVEVSWDVDLSFTADSSLNITEI